jgi:hypothetical protein
MTNELEQTLTVSVAFVGKGGFNAKIYADGDTPSARSITERVVGADDSLPLKLAPSGGAAIHLRHACKASVAGQKFAADRREMQAGKENERPRSRQAQWEREVLRASAPACRGSRAPRHPGRVTRFRRLRHWDCADGLPEEQALVILL